MTRDECIDGLQQIIDQDKSKILFRVHAGYLIHAIKYLKEQEPVKPVYQGDDSYVCDNCGETVGWDEDDSYICDACGKTVGLDEMECYEIGPIRYKYCPGCGRKVKWNG